MGIQSAMWNIRMRASRLIESENHEIKELHISGAEGIYDENNINRAINQYLKRAISHSRGRPDKIVLTVENIRQNPIKIPFLAITTLACISPEQAKELIIERLRSLGIAVNAFEFALNIISSHASMRGAALIKMKSGVSSDLDTERGVRVSRLGIDKETAGRLSSMLARLNINTTRVKEALTLASKVANHKDIIAEICISDNPDYTTGYIASKEFGYIRIPNIKNHGDVRGGRIFFIREDANVSELIKYLEKTPVIVSLQKLLSNK